jgi:VIT1/CCC1 family predicted Fe2+/Mn2+ transporter
MAEKQTGAAAARAEVARYRANLQHEVDGAALYRLMAAAAPRPEQAEVYRELAATEERHGALWRARLREAGVADPDVRPSRRARLVGWLARRFGPEAVLPLVTASEVHDGRSYRAQPDAAAAGLDRDERAHARVFRRLATSAHGGLAGEELAGLEGRHRAGGGNALRAAVLGANDGLVSNFSLVMGVAGANLAAGTVLLTGLAGLLAGAISMALGEWLSVQSSRELYARQLALERDELEASPAEEADELTLIYRAKGLPAAQARAVAEGLVGDRGAALDTLAREELGIDPGGLGGSAWAAAATSFLLFALGALLPVLPYLVAAGPYALAASVALSGMGLFAIGAGITLFTGRHPLSSGLRQVAFGLAAAAVTYGLGRLVGVGLGL